MKFRWLLIGLAAASVLSCGKQEQDERLTFTFSTSKAPLIPVPTASCTQRVQAYNSGATPTNDLAKSYFVLSSPLFTWVPKNGETAVISYMRISVTSPKVQGGTYTCLIAGEELGNLFSSVAGVPWDGKLGPPVAPNTATTKPALSICGALRCGGFPVDSAFQNSAFTAPAKVEIFGYTVGTDQSESPLKISTSFQVENIP